MRDRQQLTQCLFASGRAGADAERAEESSGDLIPNEEG